jgi:hypothetical protein
LFLGFTSTSEVGITSEAGISTEVSSGAGFEGGSSLTGNYALGAGGNGAEGAPIQVGGENAGQLCESDEPFNILFVGNSYTHFFEMPQLLADMAASAGCNVNAEMVAPGGTQLNRHAQSGETLSALGSRKWDAVVLQNFSQLPSQPLEKVRKNSLPAVKTLVDTIHQNDPSTAIYYYVTWGRRDGDKKYCSGNPLVCSPQGHTAALYRGYSLYQDELGGALVNVGGAFMHAYEDRRSPFAYKELFDPDGSHPSLKGSYMAASVFFATLFNASPEGLSYPQGLSETSAEYIQRVAARARIHGA